MTGMPDSMVGRSSAIENVRDLIVKVAPTEATVLISGESGSGKELVAQAIHARSQRGAGPFLGINCGALPPTLIESELFGFERGSFTGAARSHAGMVERASGGTLFLDEVTEMSADMQTRLLRFLETQRFFRVGGSQEIRTDVRVIAATNRSPVQAVRDGALREDLLYRLAVFPINAGAAARAWRGRACCWPITSWTELNARHGTAKSFGAGAQQTLRDYHWPGNVRELKNAIERAFIVCESELELQPMHIHAPADRAHADARQRGRHPGADRLVAGAGRTLVDRSDAGALGRQQEPRGQDTGLQFENAV